MKVLLIKKNLTLFCSPLNMEKYFSLVRLFFVFNPNIIGAILSKNVKGGCGSDKTYKGG